MDKLPNELLLLIGNYLNDYIDIINFYSVNKNLYKLREHGINKLELEIYEGNNFKYIEKYINQTKVVFFNEFTYLKYKHLKFKKIRLAVLPKNINLSDFSEAEELDLRRTMIKNVSDLRFNSNLNLSHCYYLYDVSPLMSVRILDLSYCCISDVSALANIHTLNLSFCLNITDVSPLINNYKLNLSHCENITDVSALKNTYDLNLSHCYNITDVSALGNVVKLNLFYCYKITDVSALQFVEDLDISHCYNIIDFSALGNVYKLTYE